MEKGRITIHCRWLGGEESARELCRFSGSGAHRWRARGITTLEMQGMDTGCAARIGALRNWAVVSLSA